MQSNIDERQYDSYRDARNGKSKLAVISEGDTGLLEGISYDDIQANFISSYVTNYEYYLSTVLVATIEVTFIDSAHSDVSRVRRI